jgi:methylmalonyl-CoA mutase N-terminal domain/subunit
VRAGRSAPEVASALDAVGKAAAGHDNLMPQILRAVEAYATVGEISDTLRGVWGEYAE